MGETLNSLYEIGAHGIKKAIDVKYNKRIISDLTRGLDQAFQEFSVSRPG